MATAFGADLDCSFATALGTDLVRGLAADLNNGPAIGLIAAFAIGRDTVVGRTAVFGAGLAAADPVRDPTDEDLAQNKPEENSGMALPHRTPERQHSDRLSKK